MPVKKSEYAVGLETILNNPQTSFVKNPKVFREIHSASGLSISQMIRTIGRTAKKQKNAPKPPTDDERSEARLSKISENEKTS